MAFLKATKGVNAGRVYPLKPGGNILGRNPKRCDVVLQHHAVSRQHARIEFSESHFFVEDLGSRNGVWVNGQRIKIGPTGKVRLKPFDQLMIGGFEFVFDDGSAPPPFIEAEETQRGEEIYSTVDVGRTSSFEHLVARGTPPGKLQAVLNVIDEFSDACLESIDVLMPRVMDTLFRSFPIAHNGYILLRDPGSMDFRIAASRRVDETLEGIRISRSVRDFVVGNRQAVLSGDVVQDTRFQRTASLEQLRVRSMISAPLVCGSGEVAGLIQLEVVDGTRGFAEQDLEVLAGIARHIATVIENARLHQAALDSQRIEYERRFEKLVECSPQGVLIHRDFQPLFVNDRWANLFGYSADDIERMESILPLFHRDDREAARRQAQACLTGDGSPSRYEARGIRRDGTDFWFEEFTSVVNWDGGRALLSCLIDVTERMQAAQILRSSHDQLANEVKAQQAELAASAALYRSLIEHLPMGVARRDLEGRYTFASAEFCRLVGKSEAEILHATDVELFPEEMAAKIQQEPTETKACGPVAGYVETLRGPDGEWRYVHISKTPIVDHDQAIIGTQLLMCDVTEVKRTEDERNSYALELERSNRELEQFAYTVSHDLQSPLRTVGGYCELLRRRQGDQLDGESRKFLDGAIDGAHRMKRLVDDLLTYSRLSSEPYQLQRVDSDEVLDEALSNLSAAIRETDAAVTRDDLPSVSCDRTRLMQVFQNLVGNAIRYRSHRKPEIHISARPVAGGWEFAVRDNGVGFDRRDAERIFQVFQRLYAEQEISGSGVGLALCKKIVESHGGKIWADSEKGQGSTFYFTLPNSITMPQPVATAR